LDQINGKKKIPLAGKKSLSQGKNWLDKGGGSSGRAVRNLLKKRRAEKLKWNVSLLAATSV